MLHHAEFRTKADLIGSLIKYNTLAQFSIYKDRRTLEVKRQTADTLRPLDCLQALDVKEWNSVYEIVEKDNKILVKFY
jgi:hypothetical protein